MSRRDWLLGWLLGLMAGLAPPPTRAACAPVCVRGKYTCDVHLPYYGLEPLELRAYHRKNKDNYKEM